MGVRQVAVTVTINFTWSVQYEMTILSRETWGPHLWMVLHTLAERSGSRPTVLEDTDEGYAWKGLLSHLQDIMPCALCVTHFKEAVARFGPALVVTNRGQTRRRLLRTFFWKLHNSVNERNQKEIVPEEFLERYTDQEAFRTSFRFLGTLVKTGVESGKLQLLAANKVLRILDQLRRMVSM